MQENLERDATDSFVEQHIKADRPGITMRRLLQKFADQESNKNESFLEQTLGGSRNSLDHESVVCGGLVGGSWSVAIEAKAP